MKTAKQNIKGQDQVADKPMLVVAVSSRTLFDLSESHRIFLDKGVDAYRAYQLKNENTPVAKGVAFTLVEKLLNIRHPDSGQRLVEVVLVSRNSGDTGLRVFNSIKHYGLPITRAAFTNGESPYGYLAAFGAHLFLSAHNEDVEKALEAGYAAAHLKTQAAEVNDPSPQVRIAFDGDAVLFSDESEQIYKTSGLEAFKKNEEKLAEEPLIDGPFKPFLKALHRLQKVFPADDCPIRTALVTARSAPAHKRVILTLRQWDIRLDEALFLGGLEKGQFLEAFKADIFFDDQLTHILSASDKVPAGHVPYGIANQPAGKASGAQKK